MTAPCVLKVSNLMAAYGPINALNDVSVDIFQGEIVTLIGSNGAGKSTLLMSIFGNPKPLAGKIYAFGEDITHMETHHIASKGLAIVPEGRHIFPKMSVEDNLMMGAIKSKTKSQQQDLQQIFEFFPRLKERLHQRGGTLSGGEQQMLAIGRALMSHPKLLLLDEPSLGLAPLIVKDIFRILKQIAATGTTIFLVEQNAGQALKIAQRGYVLVNGQIAMTDSAANLLADKRLQEAYLGGSS